MCPCAVSPSLVRATLQGTGDTFHGFRESGFGHGFGWRQELDASARPRHDSLMHVLVIGGNRFVGRILSWRLLAGGHRVTLLNRGRLPDPFGDRVERIVCDRTTPELGRRLRERSFDAVVDLAAFTGDDGRRAAALFQGRTGHYVMISTGQVYLVRRDRPSPAREEDYDGPVIDRPSDPQISGTGNTASGSATARTRSRRPSAEDFRARASGSPW